MRHIGRATLSAGLFLLTISGAWAQGQYPLMDRLADKVIQKYQSSSCAQLAAKRASQPSGQNAAMEQRVIRMLKQDPQMRQAFIDRVAGPIANKMFECNMIP
jgi:hypothetical protein